MGILRVTWRKIHFFAVKVRTPFTQIIVICTWKAFFEVLRFLIEALNNRIDQMKRTKMIQIFTHKNLPFEICLQLPIPLFMTNNLMIN